MSPVNDHSREVTHPSSNNQFHYLVLLEQLRMEFEMLQRRQEQQNQATNSSPFAKNHDLPCIVHLQEIASLQKALIELEKGQIEMKKRYESEIQFLKYELSRAGILYRTPPYLNSDYSPSFAFPTSSQLDQELQSFTNGFVHLQKAIDQMNSSHVNNGKRLLVNRDGEEVSTMRSVKQTHDDLAMIPSTSSLPHPSIHPLSSFTRSVPQNLGIGGTINSVAALSSPLVTSTTYGQRRGSLPSNNQTANNTGHSSSSSSSSSFNNGMDWLLVYNPKAIRTISISLLHTIPHDSVVCTTSFSPDGCILASGSNRMLFLTDVCTGRRLFSYSIGISNDISSTDTETTTIANITTNSAPDVYIRSLAFSLDGRFLASGAEDHLIRVWEIIRTDKQNVTLNHFCTLSGHSQDVYAVEFLPSNLLISGSGDSTLRIWDIFKKECLKILSPDDDGNNNDNDNLASITNADASGITSISVSHDGRLVAAGSLDRFIRLWDIENGTLVKVLKGHDDSVYSVSFSHDGKHLISGSLDKTIKLWQLPSDLNSSNNNNGHCDADEANGTLLMTSDRTECQYSIIGHKDFVLTVNSSLPDGRYILSGSKDRSVQVWDGQTGTTQLMLQGHKNSVISLAVCNPNDDIGLVNGDGTGIFATGSGDGRARIWSFQPIATTNNNPSSSSVPPPTDMIDSSMDRRLKPS